MIERSIVHLPELVKDIDQPVSNYLVHLSSCFLHEICLEKVACAREDDLSNELRFFLRNHLRDEAAEGESKEIDLFKAQRPDKGDCVPRRWRGLLG